MNTTLVNSRAEHLAAVIESEPLIETAPSLGSLSPSALLAEGGSIYYGTGLATPRGTSKGLPFDVLGMLLPAELLRREGNFNFVFHHIADTHAKTNDHTTPSVIDRRAIETYKLVKTVARNLGFTGLRPLMSSSFDQGDEYQTTLDEFNGSSDEHPYVVHELADVDWYRNNHDVRLKLGWVICSQKVSLGNDERRPDGEYCRLRGDEMSFIYTKPGRTFESGRPKASPYIALPGEARLLLEPNVSAHDELRVARNQLRPRQFEAVSHHLDQIVCLYERLCGSLGNIALDEKVQAIIDTSTSSSRAA